MKATIMTTCSDCDGTGEVQIVVNADSTKRETITEECQTCDGYGEICGFCEEPFSECCCDEVFELAAEDDEDEDEDSWMDDDDDKDEDDDEDE